MEQEYEEAKKVRMSVLGEHGTGSVLWAEEAREFLGDFHAMTVKNAYGAVWGRGGLSRRDRRLITLATLVAGRYDAELQLHLRAAFDDGVTVEEVRELFIHQAAYVGYPAALAAFGRAWPVVQEYVDDAESPEKR